MGKARAALIAVALAAVASLATVAPAGAAPSPTASAAADGRLYAYEHAYFKGDYCHWVGDHGDWRYVEWNMPRRGDCSWWYSDLDSNFNDRASSVWNNGYPGGEDDVRLYKHISWGRPYMCIGNGDYWADLNLGWERYNDGSFANDTISSHEWVTSCG